jgi:hypothetical protein
MLNTNFSTTTTCKKSKAHSDLETGYKYVFQDYWPSMWTCLFPPVFLFTTFVDYCRVTTFKIYLSHMQD